MGRKIKCKTVLQFQRVIFTQYIHLLYCFTFSLSFSLHHLSFLVRVCPNTFTYKKRYEDDFSVLFLFFNLFCSESNEIGPVGPKWNLAPQLKLTVLAVHLKTKSVSKDRFRERKNINWTSGSSSSYLYLLSHPLADLQASILNCLRTLWLHCEENVLKIKF